MPTPSALCPATPPQEGNQDTALSLPFNCQLSTVKSPGSRRDFSLSKKPIVQRPLPCKTFLPSERAGVRQKQKKLNCNASGDSLLGSVPFRAPQRESLFVEKARRSGFFDNLKSRLSPGLFTVSPLVRGQSGPPGFAPGSPTRGCAPWSPGRAASRCAGPPKAA